MRQAVEARHQFRISPVGVVRGIQADHQVGDAIALQQPLGRGQGDAQVARIQLRGAGVDDAHDLNIDAVEGAVGGHGQDGQPIADLDAHRLGQTAANKRLDFARWLGIEISAGNDVGDEPEAVFRNRIDCAAHESGGLGAVGDHAVEVDAGGDAAHVLRRADICGDLTPVFDAGIEDADFVALEVIGGEYLQVAETVVDRVFAQAVRHEGEVSAGKQQAGHASANHDQGHDGAAPVAKDVSKG